MSGLVRRRPADLVSRDPSAADLYDKHVHELLALAGVLLDSRDEAELVVAQVLREACPRRRCADDGADRRDLAREVHRRCFSARSAQSKVLFRITTDAASSPAARGLVSLSDQQRAAIGPCLFGGHTHTEAADFLALPVWVVDELLRSGLHRLSASA